MAIYKTEVLDKYMKFQEDTNDHQIRCVIQFKSQLDIDCIRLAIIQSFRLIPILGSKYVETNKKAYWETLSYDNVDNKFFYFYDNFEAEKKISEFLSKKPNEYIGPQLIASVIREQNKDTFCLVINHMAFDGSGFKQYLYLISYLYTKLVEDINYQHNELPKTKRQLLEIFKHIKLFDKLKLIFGKVKEYKNNITVFNSNYTDVYPTINTFKIDNNTFTSIKNYCKKNKITINDLILALYFKTLFVVCNSKEDDSIIIANMVDLRRYDKESKMSDFCNLSSMVKITAQNNKMDFDSFVKEINKKTSEQKSNYPGLSKLEALIFLSKILSYKQLSGLLKKTIDDSKISVTNLGIIEKDKLNFSDIPISNAYITTSLKNRPFFQLTFSTFNDTITFSISGYYSQKDKETITHFFSLFDEMLKKLGKIS